eukprot:937250-Prymnesium_polylepis.1
MLRVQGEGISLLLRKRGFAEARRVPGVSHLLARCAKTYKEPTPTKYSVGLLSMAVVACGMSCGPLARRAPRPTPPGWHEIACRRPI